MPDPHDEDKMDPELRKRLIQLVVDPAGNPRHSFRRIRRHGVRRLRQTSTSPGEGRRGKMVLVEVLPGGELKFCTIVTAGGLKMKRADTGTELWELREQHKPLFASDVDKMAKEINQQRSIDSEREAALKKDEEIRQGVTTRRAFGEGNSFVMLCRAFSMISGGFLFGSGISHNSLWGSILGTVMGIAVFALNEATVRRVEQ
jgi:hypothetical protein